MSDEELKIMFVTLKHGTIKTMMVSHYVKIIIMSRFGMRATIVWSGSGVLALGCLLRCVSLDSQVMKADK